MYRDKFQHCTLPTTSVGSHYSFYVLFFLTLSHELEGCRGGGPTQIVLLSYFDNKSLFFFFFHGSFSFWGDGGGAIPTSHATMLRITMKPTRRASGHSFVQSNGHNPY